MFASADEANMEKLTADDLTGSDPVTFASNTLEIAVPPGNPAGVETFQDLGKKDFEPGDLRSRGAVRRRRAERRGGRRGDAERR